MPQYPNNTSQFPVSELQNENLDRTVNPMIMTRGLLGKTSGGFWVAVKCTSTGFLTPNF